MIKLPTRLSQTLLARFDACEHSAYLGLKHPHARSHEMARGAAFHRFAENALRLLIEQNEPTLPPEVGKDLMNEALDQTPGVTVADADHMRVCAYHLAVGLDIDMAQIAAIEQGFALDVGDWTVVGRLDVAGFYDAQTAWIRDWKTSYNIVDQAETENDFQLRLYGVLLAFGRPVTITRESVEDDGPALGHGVETVQLSHGYPRFLGDDNLMRSRSFWASRGQLEDWRVDIERRVREVDAALKASVLVWTEDGTQPEVLMDDEDLAKAWPAIHGTHCSRCPARGECPLDESVRSWAGEVNTVEQAAEAAVWADRMRDRVAASEKELKAFASSHGPIEYGADLVREFVAQESKVTDWEGLDEAVERAKRYGEDFEMALYRKTRVSTRFVTSKREAS